MSTLQDTDKIKVHVTFVKPDGYASMIAGEYMHAVRIPAIEIDGQLMGGNFARIDNIPFFVEGLHLDDIVRFDKVEDTAVTLPGGPYYRNEVVEVVKPSGHHTVRVLFPEGADDDAQRAVIRDICATDVIKSEAGCGLWVLSSDNATEFESALLALEEDFDCSLEDSGDWSDR